MVFCVRRTPSQEAPPTHDNSHPYGIGVPEWCEGGDESTSMCRTQARSREEWKDQRRASAAVAHKRSGNRKTQRGGRRPVGACVPPQGFFFWGGGGGRESQCVESGSRRKREGRRHKRHSKRTPGEMEKAAHSSAGLSALHKNRLSSWVELHIGYTRACSRETCASGQGVTRHKMATSLLSANIRRHAHGFGPAESGEREQQLMCDYRAFHRFENAYR